MNEKDELLIKRVDVMLKEPIKLTLYADNSEEDKVFECRVIPWGMLKKALSFQSLNKDDSAVFDAMGQFVCDLYKDQFTLDDLNNGADMTEVMAVIQSVIGYAGALNPNV